MTRARELAVQAWQRVTVLGHDPVTAIEAAIVQAIDQIGTPPLRGIEALPRAQARVARALLAGPASAKQIATAFGTLYQPTRTALEALCRKGLAHRPPGRFTQYRLLGVGKPESPTLAQRLLSHLREHGPTPVKALALVLNLTPRETSDFCSRRSRLGQIHRVRPGVYASMARRQGDAVPLRAKPLPT